MIDDSNLIWIDMEMSGLEPRTDRILELACLITDSQLEILAEGPVIAVHQSEEVLSRMDEWNTTHHTASGLVAKVRASQTDEAAAERQMLDFLSQWVPRGKSPICGNTIGQDRRFLYQYMPELANYFHYRYLDVSTLKILAQRWKPEIMGGFVKKECHQALDDIRESIEELRYYRKHLLA